MRYAITSKTGNPFRRSGIVFHPSIPTILDSNEITEAIMSEPMLKAELVVDEPIAYIGDTIPEIDVPVCMPVSDDVMTIKSSSKGKRREKC